MTLPRDLLLITPQDRRLAELAFGALFLLNDKVLVTPLSFRFYKFETKFL